MTELTMKIVSHIGALSYLNRNWNRLGRVASNAIAMPKRFTAFNRNRGTTLKQTTASKRLQKDCVLQSLGRSTVQIAIVRFVCGFALGFAVWRQRTARKRCISAVSPQRCAAWRTHDAMNQRTGRARLCIPQVDRRTLQSLAASCD